MKVTLNENTCTVEREQTDSKCYNESQFLYFIKLILIRDGHDVIKKRMQKDGHPMGNEETQYIRTHNQKTGFMIYDGEWAIRKNYEPFNRDGKVVFQVERY